MAEPEKKQYRPIKKYDEQFEDQVETQGQEIRQSIALPKLVTSDELRKRKVERSVPVPEHLQDLYEQEDQNTIKDLLANVEESGILQGQTAEGAQDIGGGMMQDERALDPVNNWWNTFYNMIDEIDTERYKGQQLEAETKIDEINKKIELAEDEKQIKELEEEKEEWKSIITEMDEELIANQADIDRQKVASYYESYTNSQASQEGSTFNQYLGRLNPFSNDYVNSGEAGKDLGGAFSDVKAMAISIAAPIATQAAASAIISSGIATGSATAAGGSVTGPGALLIGGAGFVAGAGISYWAQYHAREHESYAEMYGAYEERLTEMEESFKHEKGREPSENEHAQMKKDARKGAQSVMDHNMGLYMYDLAEASLMLVPWGKSVKWLTSANKYKKWFARAGMVGGGMFLSSVNEAREEGDQYLIKNDFIKGVYDEDDIDRVGIMANGGTIGRLARAAKGIGDRGLDYSKETLSALPRVLTPGWRDEIANFAPGRTNTPEFRNSVRSGFLMGLMMGGGMGGAQAVWGEGMRRKNRYVYGNTLKDINPFLANYLNDEQTRAKAYQYYDNFKDGKYERMYAAIKNMDKMDLRTDENVNIDQELATLDKQKQLFDYLNGKEYQKAQGENNTLDDMETSDLFYTIIKMQGLKQESKEGLNEVISNLTEAYGAIDYEQKFKKNPAGFKEALQQKHDIIALKKLILKYENLGFEEAITCN